MAKFRCLVSFRFLTLNLLNKFLDWNVDPNHHQNLIIWFLGHCQHIMVILSPMSSIWQDNNFDTKYVHIYTFIYNVYLLLTDLRWLLCDFTTWRQSRKNISHLCQTGLPVKKHSNWTRESNIFAAGFSCPSNSFNKSSRMLGEVLFSSR